MSGSNKNYKRDQHQGGHNRHLADSPYQPEEGPQHAIDVAVAQYVYARLGRILAAKRIEGQRPFPWQGAVFSIAKSACRALSRNPESTLSKGQRAALEKQVKPEDLERIKAMHTREGRNVPEVLKNLPLRPPHRMRNSTASVAAPVFGIEIAAYARRGDALAHARKLREALRVHSITGSPRGDA